MSASDPFPEAPADFEPPRSEGPAEDHVRTIGRKAGRGLRWALVGTVIGKLGSFALSLVLARLLVPEDFGLFAIALSATQLALHVNDMGVIAATSQWRGRVEDIVPTATTMALLFSLAWYGLFWLAAPAYASLAGSPDATTVVRLLSATIIIDGVTAVRVGLLQRRFQQDKLTIAIMAGFFVNAPVAIILAAKGAGAYSFVIGQLCQSVVTGILVLVFTRMPYRLGFDKVVVRRLVRFGWPLAAGLAVESVLLYSDSVIVGNVLGATLLGFYLLAFNISSWMPTILSTAVRYVSIPGFSRLAEQDDDSLAAGTRKSLTLTAGVAMPLAVALMTLSPALVTFLYGDRWLPSSEPLRFLAVVMFARMLTALAFDVQTSLGNTSVPLRVNSMWVVVLVPALWVGVHVGGITGAAAAAAVVALFVAIPLLVHSFHRSGVSLRPALPALTRILLAGAVAGLVMFVVARLVGEHPLAEVLVAGGAGLLAYLLVVVPSAQRGRVFGDLRRRLRPRTTA